MNPRESIRKPEVGETETKIGETGSGRDKNKERGKQEVGETNTRVGEVFAVQPLYSRHTYNIVH